MATSITFKGHLYEVRDDESVLDALLRGGAVTPFSCRKGSCQTCLLRVTPESASPPERSRRNLRPELAQSHHFMPCVCHPTGPMELLPADLSLVRQQAVVVERELLSPRVLKLLLEPERTLSWQPGQFLDLVLEDGTARSYSIASIAEEDYYVELHVALVEEGKMSTFLHRALEVGALLSLQGPMGECVYEGADRERPLILLATGTGMAPVQGIVREALRQGHTGPIEVWHAASGEEELYMSARFAAWCNQHENLSYHEVLPPQELVATVFGGGEERAGALLYLCGNPQMVYAARVEAMRCGISRHDVRADPFVEAHPYWPQDKEKMEAWPTEPELWAALDEGRLLMEILQEFYTLAFADERLGPFFHNVTLERAISKQYEFLYDVFTGEVEFFGFKPFNAHHWMIISDELFDYREAIFERIVRRHDLPEPLVRRWLAFQELFRREIVKSTQRGLILDGEERLLSGFSEERLEFDMMCDGCHQEMLTGSLGRMHRRTGELFCERCSARAVSR